MKICTGMFTVIVPVPLCVAFGSQTLRRRACVRSRLLCRERLVQLPMSPTRSGAVVGKPVALWSTDAKQGDSEGVFPPARAHCLEETTPLPNPCETLTRPPASWSYTAPQHRPSLRNRKAQLSRLLTVHSHSAFRTEVQHPTRAWSMNVHDDVHTSHQTPKSLTL